MNESKSGEVFFTQSQVYRDHDDSDNDELSPNWVDQLNIAMNGGAQCVISLVILLS